MSPQFRELVDRQQRLLTIIWLAFIGGAVVYAVGASIYARASAGRPAELPGLPAVVAIATVGLAIAAAGAAVGRRLLAQVVQGRSFGAPSAPPPGAGAPLSPEERYLAGRLPGYRSVVIITWASYEAAAVVGIVLTLITHDLVPAAAASLVAIGLLAANRPAVAPFLALCAEWLRRQGRGGGPGA